MRQEIFVTNHNDFHHTDQYAGVEYDFPPKERVIVPVEAAVHMFGFNMPDKSDVLTRLGWAWAQDQVTKKFIEDPEGVKKLAKFVFTKAVMVEEVINAPEDAAALTPTARARKNAEFLTKPAPLV